jgi:AraC-like DNA-binding protein
MKTDEALRPVPVAYVLLTLEQATERGLSRDRLLHGIGVPPENLARPDAHVTLFQYGHLISRVLRLTGDGGLGYDFGLRANLTAHGIAGFGMMNHRTLREAVAFGVKYLFRLRSPGFTANCFIENGEAVIDVRESVQYGPLRRYAFDMLLVSMTHITRQFLDPSEVCIWFDCPEPDYYARYRHRLPPVRFDAGANQMRVPAAHLDRAIETANPVTAKLVVAQCDREMALLGDTEPVLARVRALLANSLGAYPCLDEVAARLAMSSRTLKRRLHQSGFSYRALLEEVRRRDGTRMLQDTTLSVEQIAFRLGYTAPGNFIRAFRAWTGTTPSVFRKQHMALQQGELAAAP